MRKTSRNRAQFLREAQNTASQRSVLLIFGATATLSSLSRRAMPHVVVGRPSRCCHHAERLLSHGMGEHVPSRCDLMHRRRECPSSPRRVFDRAGINLLAAFILCFIFVGSMHAEQSPAERVTEIQAALRDAKLDGWLFCDFRHSDPLAYRILKLDEKMHASRRWFYYVPASGEPVKIVQSIEQFKLDSLPGRKFVFRGWQELQRSCAKCWLRRGRNRSVASRCSIRQ